MKIYMLSLIVAICASSTSGIGWSAAIANVVETKPHKHLFIKETYTISLENQVISNQLRCQNKPFLRIPMSQYSTPEYLYKVVSHEDWQKSLQQNEVVRSSIDEGFIHLAKEDQLDNITHKFWNKVDYVVLKLASKKLVGRLVYEKNPGGNSQYYHLYERNVPLDAVVDVIKVKKP